MNIWQRIISKHWRTFITLIYVLPSWHTSTGTCSINVVTGDIIQTVSTLKQTAFSIIPIIAFLKGKTKQNNKKKHTQRNKHVTRQRKTEIDKHRFIVSWFVLQIFIYRKLYSFSYQSNLWQKLQNTINIKKKITFITFAILKSICTFATISKEGITNFIIVTMITASEMTVPPIFTRTTC